MELIYTRPDGKKVVYEEKDILSAIGLMEYKRDKSREFKRMHKKTPDMKRRKDSIEIINNSVVEKK